LVYWVATQIVPTIWIVYRLSDLSLWSSVVFFAAGFVAFTAIYEIGYFANDAWDSKRDPIGRRRTPFNVNVPYFLAFAGVRIGVWLVVGLTSGWIYEFAWVIGYCCLVGVFALHNLIEGGAVRGATFLQLAVLRIVLPALGAVGSANLVLMVAMSVFLYAYLRFLSYLDSKALLRVPERTKPHYPLSQLVLFVPMAALLAIGAGHTLPLELSAYFVALYGVNALHPFFRSANAQ
jgi:hypothetical protein